MKIVVFKLLFDEYVMYSNQYYTDIIFNIILCMQNRLLKENMKFCLTISLIQEDVKVWYTFVFIFQMLETKQLDSQKWPEDFSEQDGCYHNDDQEKGTDSLCFTGQLRSQRPYYILVYRAKLKARF